MIRDLPAIKLVGRQLGPLAKGEETELEPWEVEVLERHGFVEPIKKFATMDIRKFIFAEERESEPASLPLNFYSMVIQKISSLRAAGEYGEAEEIKAQVATLIEVRVPKLLRLALFPENPVELPPEERFLINRLAATLDNWSRRLNELFEKSGEEAGKNGFGRSVRRVVEDKADIQKQGIPAPELHARGTAPS